MTKLVKINPADYGLNETKAKEIENAFAPMLKVMTELETEYNAVLKKEINEETVKEAKILRLKYVKVRTTTAGIHKEMKAFYLSGGRAVDGWKNAQLHASQGNEEKLTSIEKHFENIEIHRLAKIRTTRQEALHKINPRAAIPEGIESMEDDVWDNYVMGVKMALQQSIDAEKKAEEDRIAKEQAEEAERKRIKEENDRLLAEAEESARIATVEAAAREKVEAARMAKEKAAKEEALKREKNLEHRKKINKAILDVFVAQGCDMAIAMKIITMVAKKEIPNIKIEY